MCADQRRFPETEWLSPDDHANRHHFGRWPSPRERRRERTLKEWFGEDFARAERLEHQRSARPVGDGMDEVFQRIGLADVALLTEAREIWPEIAGEQVAAVARPVACRNGCLTIEVESSTWMFTLQRRYRSTLNNRLADRLGTSYRELQFTPAGRHGR